MSGYYNQQNKFREFLDNNDSTLLSQIKNEVVSMLNNIQKIEVENMFESSGEDFDLQLERMRVSLDILEKLYSYFLSIKSDIDKTTKDLKLNFKYELSPFEDEVEFEEELRVKHGFISLREHLEKYLEKSKNKREALKKIKEETDSNSSTNFDIELKPYENIISINL